ncbi:EI24 domain-containing protein [Myxococcota bacterium]|nr:EI24 domain-containing protein [Myxococcota bacterium]
MAPFDERNGSLTQGVGFLLEAVGMLRRERRLWLLAIVPVLLSFTSFVIAVTLIIGHASEIHQLAAGWLPAPDAERWYEWLWVGPALALLRVAGWLLFLLLSALYLIAAYLVASLLAAPFHDLLSLRVEQLCHTTSEAVESSGPVGWATDTVRSLWEEAKKLAFFASIVVPLGVVGFVLPGAQVITGPLVLGFTVLFLPLDYASYSLDRRGVGFPARRRWVLDHLPLMTGFGGAAVGSLAVPGLNFLAMPVLVVGGTLLAIRKGPHLDRDEATSR